MQAASATAIAPFRKSGCRTISAIVGCFGRSAAAIRLRRDCRGLRNDGSRAMVERSEEVRDAEAVDDGRTPL
jgi:hypothetical protein